MSFFGSHKRADTFRTVFAFLWGHWRRRPTLLASIMAGMLVATLGEVLVPIFVGRLVDALSTAQGGAEAARLVARAVALNAFLAILALGAVTVLVRHFAFMGIVTLTLRMMSDIAADAFARVQRFSSDWHANAFAGSTVRKISRG
ncbi:MAG: multidrug ABC transporter ATP-binding protein, partial [Azorhizobium sp. 35-67-15]